MLSRKDGTSDDIADGEDRRDVADNLAGGSIRSRHAVLVYALDSKEADVGSENHSRL